MKPIGLGWVYGAFVELIELLFITFKLIFMPYANLQITFTEADYLLAQQDIINLMNKFPFAVNLTPKEKSSNLHLGPKTLMFVKKSLLFYTNKPLLHTGFLPLSEWQNDWDTMQRLDMLLAQVNILQEMLADTVMALRMENTTSALTFYKILKSAAQQNVPGTTDVLAELKVMLPGTFKNKKTPPTGAPNEPNP